MKTRPTSGGEATSLSPSRRHGRPLAVPPLGGDRHKRESPPRRGKMVAISAKSPTLGSTRVDSAPSTRRALEGGWPYLWGRSLAGWSWSSEASGVPSSRKGAVPPGDRANAPAIRRALEGGTVFYGGGQIAGSGTPASPASSPTSRPETISSSGSAKARVRRAPVGGAGDRAGARAPFEGTPGTQVGIPRWLGIFPTTSGSERSASTIKRNCSGGCRAARTRESFYMHHAAKKLLPGEPSSSRAWRLGGSASAVTVFLYIRRGCGIQGAPTGNVRWMSRRWWRRQPLARLAAICK